MCVCSVEIMGFSSLDFFQAKKHTSKQEMCSRDALEGQASGNILGEYKGSYDPWLINSGLNDQFWKIEEL